MDSHQDLLNNPRSFDMEREGYQKFLGYCNSLQFLRSLGLEAIFLIPLKIKGKFVIIVMKRLLCWVFP